MHQVLYNNKANEAKENKKWINKTLILQIQNKVGINISTDDFLSIIHSVFFAHQKKGRGLIPSITHGMDEAWKMPGSNLTAWLCLNLS